MFTMEIKTGNAAFGEDAIEESYEIARILRETAANIEGTTLKRGSVNDINGNKVATWSRN